MKSLIVLLSFFVQCVFAQVKSNSTATQTPDSLEIFGRSQFQRLMTQKPKVERDGVVIGNMKFFIMICPTDPSIDPGMIIRIPDSLNVDRMPELHQNAPSRPMPDSTRRFRFR